METGRTIRGELRYVKQLADAGWTGLRTTAREIDGPVFSPPLQQAAWGPMAAGAALGLIGTRRADRARKASGMAVGTAVGLAAAAAWASWHVTKVAARRAARRINEVRDAHWLELNPIDYA